MKGKVIDGKRSFSFGNLRQLSLEVAGKPWVLDPQRLSDTQIVFKVAPMGGFAGWGNYLKQWRKRNKLTQGAAAEKFRVSQSLIAKIEGGERELSGEMFELIRENNRKTYGKE